MSDCDESIAGNLLTIEEYERSTMIDIDEMLMIVEAYIVYCNRLEGFNKGLHHEEKDNYERVITLSTIHALLVELKETKQKLELVELWDQPLITTGGSCSCCGQVEGSICKCGHAIRTITRLEDELKEAKEQIKLEVQARDAAVRHGVNLEEQRDLLRCCGTCRSWHHSGLQMYCVLDNMSTRKAGETCDEWQERLDDNDSPKKRKSNED